MHAAENLVWHINTVRLAAAHTVQRAAPGAVYARQTEHPCSALQPSRVGIGTSGAPSTACGGGFVHPRAACIAINPGGGEIAEPFATQCIAIGFEHRVDIIGGRDTGKNVGGLIQCGVH